MSSYMEMLQISIAIETLQEKEKTFDTIMELSDKINMNSKDLLEEFFKKSITSPEKMYQYVLNPEWGEASGNYRMRYMVVSIDSDFVLVPLKVMDPMGKGRYFSISMELISNEGKIKNILKVLEVFKLYSCIQFIMLPGNFSGKEVYMNNYFNTLEEFNQMNRSVWKSKKGVNKMSNIITLETDYPVEYAEACVKQVDDLWNAQKKSEKKVTLPAKVDITLTKMWGRYQGMFLYLYFYKGVILGYSLGVTTCEKYISLLSTKSLTQLPLEQLSEYLNEPDLEVVKQIQKFLGAYIQYTIHKDILLDKEYPALYYYGDVHSKSLQEFKQDYYKRIINYYKVSLQEYEDLIKSGV